MALTLVKEDGTGKPDANSYADVAAGDAYFEVAVHRVDRIFREKLSPATE